MFLLTVLFLPACEKNEDMVYRIPGEQKFLFQVGDTLYYKCSDGSNQHLMVGDIRYNLETGTRQGLFKDYDDTYSIQICEIDLSCEKDDWNGHINMDCEENITYTLIFNPQIVTWGTFIPHSTIMRQCPSGIAWDVAFSPHLDYTFIDTLIDGKEYYNVFTYQIHPDRLPAGGEQYRFIWNMNYGIIRFEVISETEELHWTWVDTRPGRQ